MKICHYHNGYELYFQVDGFRGYFINNESYSVEPGTAVFVTKRDIHRTISDGSAGYERILVSFSDDFIEEFAAPLYNFKRRFVGRL